MTRYITTINLVVEAERVTEAEDGIAETFRNLQHDTTSDPPFVVDWGYQFLPGWRKPGGIEVFAGPVVEPIPLPAELQTGDLDEVHLQPYAPQDGVKADALRTLKRLTEALRDRQRLHGEDITNVLAPLKDAEAFIAYVEGEA